MIENISAEEALKKLKEGNARYIETNAYGGDVSSDKRAYNAINGQKPYAIVVACSDSRVIPEAIFSCGVGDIFVIRVAGNVIGDMELGSIEYAAGHLGVKLCVILGHTHCGAVGAAMGGDVHGKTALIAKEISSAIGCEKDEKTASMLNVVRQAKRLRRAMSWITVAEAVYDIESGAVEWNDGGERNSIGALSAAHVMRDRIETERLVLRKATMEDAEEMFNNWASDPEVTKWLTWDAHKSVEVTKTIIARWIDDYDDPKTVRYVITKKDTGEAMGSIDIVYFYNGIPEVGDCIGKKYWNQGYMTEACKAFLQELKRLGYDKARIRAHIDNIGSNRVIEKCGGEYFATVWDWVERLGAYQCNEYYIDLTKI